MKHRRRRDPSAASRGLLGFMLGLTIAAWLTHNIGPSPDVWGGLLP